MIIEKQTESRGICYKHHHIIPSILTLIEHCVSVATVQRSLVLRFKLLIVAI